MPAPLDFPASKRDVNIYDEDYAFLSTYLGPKGLTFAAVTRELVHRYANAKRLALGLEPTAPHPPNRNDVP